MNRLGVTEFGAVAFLNFELAGGQVLLEAPADAARVLTSCISAYRSSALGDGAKRAALIC